MCCKGRVGETSFSPIFVWRDGEVGYLDLLSSIEAFPN